MKYIKPRNLITEDTQEKTNKGSTSIIFDLCVCMLLINPNFLDKLLDVGLKARYSEDSSIFLNDLKNLLFAKNRLKVGKFVEDRCVEDPEMNRINSLFNQYSNDFNIEQDWNKLIKARNLARNIQDKLLIDEKLTSEMVTAVYWIGPNKTDDHNEDMVVEIATGKQFSININKKINLTKTQSFNTVLSILFNKSDNLFSDDMLPKWDKLVREWVKLVYTNSKPNIKAQIKKFIDPERIESLTYFGYFDIKHSNPNVAILGEFIPELNENILNFSDLMSEIWKQKEKCLDNLSEVDNEWNEKKIFILNSRIIEYYITSEFKKITQDKAAADENGFIKSTDKVKMRIAKLILDTIGSQEKDVYYFTTSGDTFYRIPERDFFRKNYDDLTILYDCHTELTPSKEDEELNNSNFKIKLMLDENQLLLIDLETKFSGGEMSGRFSSKYKIEFAADFNYQIHHKEMGGEIY